MRKNKMAHNGEIGIWAIPSGYATKANPGPEKDALSIINCLDFIQTSVNGGGGGGTFVRSSD